MDLYVKGRMERKEKEYITADNMFTSTHKKTGLMKRRDASINDVKIKENERRYVRNAKTGMVEYPQGHP